MAFSENTTNVSFLHRWIFYGDNPFCTRSQCLCANQPNLQRKISFDVSQRLQESCALLSLSTATIVPHVQRNQCIVIWPWFIVLEKNGARQICVPHSIEEKTWGKAQGRSICSSADREVIVEEEQQTALDIFSNWLQNQTTAMPDQDKPVP